MMSLGVASFLLNLLITGLLMATISYCWVLNKRIKILQDSKSELSNLLKYFDESTTKASESIVALQTASKKIGENIQIRIDKANYLIDDLAFMIEKGNRLADQLDANFAVNRARSIANNDIRSQESSEDEMEYTETKTIVKPQPVIEKTKPKIVEQSVKESASSSLEAVLERVIGRVKPSKNSAKADNNNRSKAEQELLDMIRAGIKG